MECCAEHIINVNNKVDPTRTTTLRTAFSKDMKRRFVEICRGIATAVYEKDCFGLNENIHTLQVTPPDYQAFAFLSSAEKLEAFMKWLQQQVDKGLLSVSQFMQLGSFINKSWTGLYVLDAYKRGILRARMEMKKAGYDVPSIEETGGIMIAIGMLDHVENLGLLYTRTFNELKGVTNAMDQQISRILAQGLADGDSPLLLARKLVAVINGQGIGDLGITDSLGRFIPTMRRADMIARTELIRSFHIANIQEMRNWGVEGVYAEVEFRTAGDNRVCSRCQALEGKVYTLDEAEGVIPVHIGCRCMMLPQLIKKTKN